MLEIAARVITTYDLIAMTTRDSLLLIIAVAALLSILAIIPFTRGARHASDTRLATDHIPVITSKLSSDGRFQAISVSAISRYGVHIYVSGAVKDDFELIALRALVQSTEPPLDVKYGLSVGVED